MSRPNALVCAALVGLSGAAQASEKPKLVLVPFAAGEGASEASARRFEGLVRDELKSRGDAAELVASPVTKAPVAAGAGPGPGKRAPSAEALGALEAGRKAFDDLRFPEAIPSLKKGIEAMLQDPGTADSDVVTDAWVKLAASAFRLGEEKEAKSALQDLARFAPQHELPSGYPPVFQREFEKAKLRLGKQPRASISIEGPPGSTAFVNARDLGMVPVLEENLPAGLHYVKVEGPKGERWGQVVELKGALVKVRASFGPAGERVVATAKQAVADPGITATLDEGTLGRVSAYAKAANAEYAVVGYVYKTADTQLTAGTALYAAKRGAFVALQPVSFDVDVLTANTEAFKVADEVGRKLASFGAPGTLPLNLASRTAKAGTSTAVAAADVPRSVDPDEPVAATPSAKKVKVTLVPRDPPKAEPAPLAEVEPPPPDEVKAPPGKAPIGWIIVGVVGGAAVVGTAAFFGIAAATSSGPFRPVTGTVTATW